MEQQLELKKSRDLVPSRLSLGCVSPFAINEHPRTHETVLYVIPPLCSRHTAPPRHRGHMESSAVQSSFAHLCYAGDHPCVPTYSHQRKGASCEGKGESTSYVIIFLPSLLPSPAHLSPKRIRIQPCVSMDRARVLMSIIGNNKCQIRAGQRAKKK